MNANFRSLALWVIIGLLLVALVPALPEPDTASTNSQEVPFSQFCD